ncbi:MAG: amino acid--tRNA ligase-related protein [Patescibacteria group bacterium]
MSILSRTLISSTPDLIGQEVLLNGWVDTKRDHGKVTFIDLRDRSGKVQCVAFNQMGELTTESVVEVVGQVKARPEKLINKNLPTGGVEIEVKSYRLLNKCFELPITLDSDGKEIGEEPRLKYRYVDLRRPRMQKILRMRSKLIDAIRQQLFKKDFVEIETPLLTKSTKEGARDFIVPSRFQPGKFYALPQSPQQYKQLLMTAGFERYFQVARCIRDEDLRADRGFEFTQLDIEMSFVKQQDVMKTVEEMVKNSVKQVGGQLKDENFPVFTYKQALEKYGADKFDLRSEEEKAQGVLAFAWVIDFPFFKKVDKADVAEVRDGKSGWTFTHNPFSTPQPQCLEDHLAKRNIGEILTAQYDLVCNGYEVGGGSIRAHQPEVLRTTMEIMGYKPEEVEESIGHMLRAFELGTPPHGGIALGLDRLVMLLANESSLKETIAFPMTSTGRTAVMDGPSYVSDEQLAELSIAVKTGEGLSPHDYILEKLQQTGCSFQYLSHEPVKTSEESAKVRGTSIEQAAKALVLEVDKEYLVYVLPGNERADLDSLKSALKAKKINMASKDSVLAKTGLEVGAIPPFGSAMGLRTIVHQHLAKNDNIAFNVGRHDRSVVMKYQDFIKLEKPELI